MVVHISGRTSIRATILSRLTSTYSTPRCSGTPAICSCTFAIKSMHVPPVADVSCPQPPSCSNSARSSPGDPAMTVDAATVVHDIMASEAYHRARAVLAAEHGRTVLDIVNLTEVPAPSFQEDVRGAAWMEMAR